MPLAAFTFGRNALALALTFAPKYAMISVYIVGLRWFFVRDNKPYQLDASAKASSLDPPTIKTAIFLIVFSAAFLGFGTYWLIDFVILRQCDWEKPEGFFVPLFFAIAGFISCVIAVVFLIRQLRKKKIQTRIIRGGKAVVAVISRYKCQEKTRQRSGGTFYEVSFSYTYRDLEDNTVSKQYKGTMDFSPQLFEGSKLMLAIDGSDTVILSNFSLSAKSERKLKKSVSADETANFEGLDGSKVNVDRDSTIITAGFFRVRFWAGIALAIFCGIVSCIMIPLFLTIDVVVIKIVFGCLLGVVFAPLVSFAVYLIVGAVKGERKEKRILAVCDFARANINIPTDVYTTQKQHHATFCFIDCKGKNAAAKSQIQRRAG
jgi:hypothetical protein